MREQRLLSHPSLRSAAFCWSGILPDTESVACASEELSWRRVAGRTPRGPRRRRRFPSEARLRESHGCRREWNEMRRLVRVLYAMRLAVSKKEGSGERRRAPPRGPSRRRVRPSMCDWWTNAFGAEDLKDVGATSENEAADGQPISILRRLRVGEGVDWDCRKGQQRAGVRPTEARRSANTPSSHRRATMPTYIENHRRAWQVERPVRRRNTEGNASWLMTDPHHRKPRSPLPSTRPRARRPLLSSLS